MFLMLVLKMCSAESSSMKMRLNCFSNVSFISWRLPRDLEKRSIDDSSSLILLITFSEVVRLIPHFFLISERLVINLIISQIIFGSFEQTYAMGTLVDLMHFSS